MILETERLFLRPCSLDDHDDIYHLVYADPVVKNAWSGATGTPEEIKARFAERSVLPESDFGFKAICLKETAVLIGLMGFQQHQAAQGEEIYYLLTESEPNRCVGFDPNFIEAELTYAFGRDYWKQGYAQEMGKAVVDYGFEVLKIGRIIQGVLTSNVNSINLMQRLGFRIELGLYPKHTIGILNHSRHRD